MEAIQPSPSHRRESDEALDRRMIDWLVWKVTLPLIIFVVIWLAYKWVCKMDHPFERAFAHGDLLIFSALVLIEAVTEGEHQHGQSNFKRVGLQLAKVVAISFIMIFGFIKYDVIINERAAVQEAVKKGAEVHAGEAPAGAPPEARQGVLSQAAASLVTKAPSAEDELMSKMLLYSYLNCAVAAVSVVFSVFAFWSSVNAEKSRQYDSLKGDAGSQS